MKPFKYYCTLDFGYGDKPIKFTSVELERVMAKLNKLVEEEQQRRIDNRQYTFVEFEFKAEVR